jgi:hypothetical protein
MIQGMQKLLNDRSGAKRIFQVISALGLIVFFCNDRAFSEQSSEDRRHQDATTKASRIAAAKSISQSPTMCIRSYEAALYKAKSLEQVLPYFSTRYQQSRVSKLNPFQRGKELSDLKSAYAFALGGHDGPPVARESISDDGGVNVHLEGKNSYNGEWKGVEVRFKLVPESGYWKIDDYRAETGLQLLKISIPQERKVHQYRVVRH